MKVYSPSASTNWMASPASHYLNYIGRWQPRRVNRGGLARILGSGFTKAVAEFWLAGGPGGTIPGLHDQVCGIAEKSVLGDLSWLNEAGATFGQKDMDLMEALPLKAKSAIAKYMADPKIPTGYIVEAVEPPMPEHGWARPDLILKYERDFAPLDFKCKLTAPRKGDTRYLDEINHAWQMMHYTWATGQIYNCTPGVFYVVYIILEPTIKVTLHDFYIDDEILQLWLNSARTVWALMEHMETGDTASMQTIINEHGKLYPWHTFQWFDRWGKLEYTDAILDCKLHEHLIAKDYIKKRSRK